MFPIQITIHNPGQLNAVMAALGVKEEAAAPFPPLDPAPTPAAASGPATAAAPEAAAPSKTADASAPAAASAEAAASPSTAATDKAEPVTYAQVKPVILELVSKRGREAGLAALGKFKVEKGTDLKPEDYGPFLVHARAVLSGEAVAA